MYRAGLRSSPERATAPRVARNARGILIDRRESQANVARNARGIMSRAPGA